ncbi:twin-arginine translocase subunit TatC [Paenibacillus apiarius]|uniref:twin-arginine translocase subunit TatC n=2 Tax=Paenibacillus apiarius TaxID=46240 RepID=UPI002DBFAC86|nr:twin-arginine translocase subunit TatC [Paenibacillus apiarius]
MIQFLVKMNQSIGAMETYGIDRCFTFMFNVVFSLGVAFEMPLIILFECSAVISSLYYRRLTALPTNS